MANRSVVNQRKDIIADVIARTGLTKKRLIIEHIRKDPKLSPPFSGLSARRFREIILFEASEEVLDPSHKITGRSVHKNSKGEIITEWVKTSVDREVQNARLMAALDEMRKTIKPIKSIPLPQDRFHLSKICNMYAVTDYHLGMFAWKDESGEDWDTKMAEDMLIKWFEQAITSSPNAETAVFAQIGDFLHFDGMEAVTPTSKHVLDGDVRYQQLVRIAIRAIRKIVNMMLLKYKSIHLINVTGNHDMASAVWLRELFHTLYENEPRVTVDNTADLYHCHVWGSNCLFFNHGHKKKLGLLDAVFVSKFKKEFGSSKHVYAHTGHYHHEKVLETNLMIVEQHPTLAAKDAHSSGGGYASRRNARVISYHKDHGEVNRISQSPYMLS